MKKKVIYLEIVKKIMNLVTPIDQTRQLSIYSNFSEETTLG